MRADLAAAGLDRRVVERRRSARAALYEMSTSILPHAHSHTLSVCNRPESARGSSALHRELTGKVAVAIHGEVKCRGVYLCIGKPALSTISAAACQARSIGPAESSAAPQHGALRRYNSRRCITC